MKEYFSEIKQKPAHERRQHAMRIASGVMAVVFVAWVATIGVRLTTAQPGSPQTSTSNQIANVLSGGNQTQATLLVATSSDTQY